MKNILLISHNALSFQGNNGKTLASIFADWESECFAQIYFNNEVPESFRFKKFFRFSELDILRGFVGLSVWRGCGSPVRPQTVSLVVNGNSSFVKAAISSFVKNRMSLKLLLREFFFAGSSRFLGRMEEWIRRFRPDSIFFVGGNSVFSFRISHSIARKLRIPIDIYITDDYVLYPKPAGLVGRWLLARLRQVYRESFKDARHVFVIGDEMASAFAGEFNRSFVPVMNSVVVPDCFPRSNLELQTPGVADFVYAGGLHLGRWESLVRFGALLRDVSDQFGVRATLTVHAVQMPESDVMNVFKENGVIFGGALDSEAVVRRFQQADFVLHVESFDRDFASMTKLSVSTKIPEYLASGACVVGFGPSDLASIRLISENAIGVTLTEEDSASSMVNKLGTLLMSSAFRHELSVAGFNYAKTMFSADVVRSKVESLLNY